MLAPIALALAALLAAPAARADDEAEGKERFKRGQELYREGKFIEAAREFEAGFAAAPRPLFLLNIGHSYRRAQEFKKAKRAYELLLKVEPDTPYRAEVESLIKNIDDALQGSEPPEPPPRPPLVEPRPEEPPPPLSLRAPSPPPVVLAKPTPPPDSGDSDSVFRKAWFWVLVGGVVAGGVTAAVVAAGRGSHCPRSVDRCFSEGQAP
jgi:tetratricopeptide (TPR) repeat protein